MLHSSPIGEAAHQAPAPKPLPPRFAALIGARDPRLDFFRGIAMFIILIAHTPNNMWTLWIPARFGWSDATEIFVFCSGMASAIAFGRVFERAGLGLGAVRVGFRLWQVYWAHVGLFIVTAATMAAFNLSGWFEVDYIDQLNLQPFYANVERNLPAFLALVYVPNYFDILPMYILALALMPAVVGLYKVHPGAAMAFVLGLWGITQLGYLDLPAEPWSERTWFFNPFAWQLIFYSGFAFMSGWLPKPPVHRGLVCLAAAFVILSVVPAYYWGWGLPDRQEIEPTAFQSLRYWLNDQTLAIRHAIGPLIFKPDFGLFRFIHFLSLAYLAWVIVGPRGSRLIPHGDGKAAQIWGAILAAILKVGQQSLAIFVFSMWYARVQGLFLDEMDRTPWAYLIVNVTGLLMLVAVAYFTSWIKSHPWRPKPTQS